jgi:hypothetical protein
MRWTSRCATSICRLIQPSTPSVEKFAVDAIMDEWKLGVRHKIVLANKAIAVIEDRHPLANELRRVRKAG